MHVVARFLDKLQDKPLSKSALQRATGTNYDIFRRYLDYLESRGFVELTKTTVKLTEDGRRVHRELHEWLARLFSGSP